MFRDHVFGEDGQARPVRGAAVRSPYRASLCDYGEVCQPHTCCERMGSNSLLASGGGLCRLYDLCDPSGVGSSEISESEAAEVHLEGHTVVSRAVRKELSQCHSDEVFTCTR